MTTEDDEVIARAADRISRIESGEDLVTVYNQKPNGLGEIMACTEREGDYRQLALKYLAGLITPPTQGEGKPFTLNVSEEWIRKAAEDEAGYDIAAGQAALMQLEEQRQPRPDIESALADALEGLMGICHWAWSDESLRVQEAMNKARAALAMRDKEGK